MRASEAYKALRIELDKWESPTASIGDFNYFFMSSVHELTDSKHVTGPDAMQGDHDDIQVLLSDPTDLTFGGGVTSPLPEFYRNILDLKLVFTFTERVGKYKIGDTLISYPKKSRTARAGYIGKNAYQQPKLDRSWYILNKDSITIEKDPAVTITSGQMTFYTRPDVVFLNPDYADLSASDRLLEANDSILQFPDHTVAKLIKICRRIMLENIESGRYSTVLNENNLAVK